MIRFILTQGIGFSPGSVQYLPTLGFSTSASGSPVRQLTGTWNRQTALTGTWSRGTALTGTWDRQTSLTGTWNPN